MTKAQLPKHAFYGDQSKRAPASFHSKTVNFHNNNKENKGISPKLIIVFFHTITRILLVEHCSPSNNWQDLWATKRFIEVNTFGAPLFQKLNGWRIKITFFSGHSYFFWSLNPESSKWIRAFWDNVKWKLSYLLMKGRQKQSNWTWNRGWKDEIGVGRGFPTSVEQRLWPLVDVIFSYLSSKVSWTTRPGSGSAQFASQITVFVRVIDIIWSAEDDVRIGRET